MPGNGTAEEDSSCEELPKVLSRGEGEHQPLLQGDLFNSASSAAAQL